jgi:hypothetical protein
MPFEDPNNVNKKPEELTREFIIKELLKNIHLPPDELDKLYEDLLPDEGGGYN